MNDLIQTTIAQRKTVTIPRPELSLMKLFVPQFEAGKLAGQLAEMIAADEAPVFRAVVGTGGSKEFLITTGFEGAELTAPEIVGVILGASDYRVFFDDASPGDPPACYSNDMEMGRNRRTDELCSCAGCLHAKRTSGGRAECRQKVRLWMLVEGGAVPLAVELPPASLAPWKRYRRSLIVAGLLEPHEVVTKITLTTEQTAAKIRYSRAAFTPIGRPDEEAAAKIADLRRMLFPPEPIEGDFKEAQVDRE